MRSIYRTLGPALVRSVALVCLADALVGLSFGAIAVSTGFPLWVPMVLSVVVFAGAAQFLFIGLIAAGGSPLAAVAAALLVNARHLPFGFAVGDAVVGDAVGRAGWLRRLVGSHLMTDETVAFTLAEDDPRRRRAVYWATGTALFVCWNVSVVLGGLAGSAISDTGALGLDAAFPAVLLALVLPSLNDPKTRWAALIGLVVALATTPLLPAGAPVLLALSGVMIVEVIGRWKRTPAW
ncbi:AzlC family ABC transporter permease [Cryptosporangium sp. NPDC048952]|uniref:AzlC family ABC transporter permease n=1 Tax=Cryptosporangium sp. NPDC048952 TaxID=3363961 RepID=UPI003711AC41